MKTKNHILALTSIVLVLFLFAPVLIRTLNGSNEANLKHFAVSATSGSPSKLDAQLPFEEREKEEEAIKQLLNHQDFGSGFAVVGHYNAVYAFGLVGQIKALGQRGYLAFVHHTALVMDGIEPAVIDHILV